MKKSIGIAIAEAKKLHGKRPDINIRVMDKKGERAICTTSDWVYRERVLNGYSTVFFIGGTKEVETDA